MPPSREGAHLIRNAARDMDVVHVAGVAEEPDARDREPEWKR